jgi:5-methylcytosine-specific restriction endonuclease McrA
MTIKKSCIMCGKDFSVPRYREHTAKFCSVECHGLSRSPVVLKCSICGKDYIAYGERSRTSQYCSYSCAYTGRRKKTTKPCEFCGKIFEVSLCVADRYKYCSSKCRGLGRERNTKSRSVIKVCEVCGREYGTNQYRALFSKYCSIECSGVAKRRRTQKTCLVCGKLYVVKDSLARQICCSRACVTEYIRPDSNNLRGFYESSFWKSKRDEILKRDGYECTRCSSTSDLHVHHIVRKGNGGGESPSNLITLCSSCHAREHLRVRRN